MTDHEQVWTAILATVIVVLFNTWHLDLARGLIATTIEAALALCMALLVRARHRRLLRAILAYRAGEVPGDETAGETPKPPPSHS